MGSSGDGGTLTVPGRRGTGQGAGPLWVLRIGHVQRKFPVQDGPPSLHSKWVLEKHGPPASAFSRNSLKDRLMLSMPSSGRRSGKAVSAPFPGPLLEDGVARLAAQGRLLSLPAVIPRPLSWTREDPEA